MEKPKPEPTENAEAEVEQREPTDARLVGEPDIPHDDSTAPIRDQALEKGFVAEYYNFGLLEGDGSEYFNPAIVQRPDGYWLLTRRSQAHPHFRFGQNDVWAFMLDETGKVPKMGKRLKWTGSLPLQHFEDPRGFYHPAMNCVCVGACTFMWYENGRWSGAHQIFGQFEEDWTCKQMDYPRIGGNPGQIEDIKDRSKYEKNWLWFLHDGALHLLYKANPWQIFGFTKSWGERREYLWTQGGVHWAWGEIRGGTSPIKVGDYYFTFHHSSLPWRGRYRRYYAGALAFDAAPPFRPRLITRDPILIGSQNDTWHQRKPLVVFPCGAVLSGKWLVSMGVNDMRAAWMEIHHEHLLSLMTPVDDGKDPIFGASGLSEGEVKTLKIDESLFAKQLEKAEKEIKPRRRARRKLRRKKRQFTPEQLQKLRERAAHARAARMLTKH